LLIRQAAKEKMVNINMDDLFRIERDTLGEIRVPRQVLYGAQTQRAVDNFPISGLKPWWQFIWSMVIIKRCAARVNQELGLLQTEYRDAILQACDEILAGKWNDQFVVDPFQAGAGTSHNMNINEVIANLATRVLGGSTGQYIIHPNNHVNMSQSTNDTVPTAIRIGVLGKLDELLSAIKRLSASLREKEVEFDDVIKSGRTHLQDAVPIRLGQEFGAYACAVERDRQRIIRSADTLRRLGIGGTAAGSGLNAHPLYHEMMINQLAIETGLILETSDNLFESMQSMADMADFSSTIRTLAITLTRIANDIRLLASGPNTGLNEIILPAVQPGSSIMPGKVNPVMAEMLNMAMFHIMGNDHTIALAAQSGQLELNVMMPVIAHNLFEMMQIAIGSIHAFTNKCVVGIQTNKEIALGWLERNPIIITALTPMIGYHGAAELVRYSNSQKVPIRQAVFQYLKQGKLIHISENRLLTIEEVERALSQYRKMTEGGIISI